MKQLPAAQRIQLLRQADMAIAANPKNVKAHFQRGMVLAQEHRFDEAATALAKALSLDKKNVQILEQLARFSFLATNHQKAKQYARKLCELEPRNLRHILHYAEILEITGQVDLALKQFEKARKLAPGNVMVLDQTANCLRMAGRNDEAAEIHRQILTIDPSHSHTLYLVAHSSKFGKEEAETLYSDIKRALKRQSDPLDRTNLYFSAGKIMQDAGEYDIAFENFQKANELSDVNVPDIANPIVNSLRTFDRAYFEERRESGNPTTQPVFILGMPRSGTTLVESLCGAHSKIAAGDELPHMNVVARDLGLDMPPPNNFREKMRRMGDAEIRQSAKRYLDYCVKLAANKPHFTDKLPHNFQRIGVIRTLFPRAKIIHCCRHPVDNCVSLYTNSMKDYHNGYKADLKKLGAYYRRYTELMAHWRAALPEPMHEIYYEDVVVNTELNARRLIDYLELDWQDGVMERQSGQKSVRTLSAWQVRQPVYTSSAGRWRHYERHLGPLIEALGPVVDDYEHELASLTEPADNAVSRAETAS